MCQWWKSTTKFWGSFAASAKKKKNKLIIITKQICHRVVEGRITDGGEETPREGAPSVKLKQQLPDCNYICLNGKATCGRKTINAMLPSWPWRWWSTSKWAYGGNPEGLFSFPQNSHKNGLEVVGRSGWFPVPIVAAFTQSKLQPQMCQLSRRDLASHDCIIQMSAMHKIQD